MGVFVAMAVLAVSLPNAVVLKPVANMHAKPTEEADVVSQAIYGSNVGILEQNREWVRIRTADDYTGWMALTALRREPQPYAVTGRVAQVWSLFAHLYREPGVTRHQPLLTVPFETRLQVIGEQPGENGWLEVQLPDDRAAWVQAGDVTFDSGKLSIAQTLELSKRFLGLPYTWGGTSSFGYDCSGFVQMLCRRRGYSLPRDAAPQAAWQGMMPVERKDLQPGDLLYF